MASLFGTISIYPTPDSLQAKVDEYFDYCFIMENKFGRMVPKVIVPPTFSGLARYLGFGTRRALLDYVGNNGNELFEDVLNDAKLRIEDFYEGRLVMSKGPSTGLQFALKNNCNWEDTSKQQITGADDKAVVFSWGFDDKQLDAREQATVDAALVEALPEPKHEPISKEEKEEATNRRFDNDPEPKGEDDEPADYSYEVDF